MVGKFLGGLCVAVATCWGWAAAAVPEGELARLADHPTWQHLGRYERNWIPGSGRTSDVLSGSYFLSPQGRHDPLAELNATLAGLEKGIGENPDESILCRFPARALFLAREGAVDLPDPLDVCPEFREFLSQGQVNSVSVLFISGFLSNPGSAFGHLLLRFRSEDEALGVQDVLDQAINYGAAESEEDAMIPYIAKGIFGGYRSRFTTLPFYHQNERYRENQLRDVWEYQLALDEADVRLLTAHIWELLQSENRYYFMRQNCAYRMAEVLELVVDRDLIPRGKLWVAPIDVFHRLTGDEDDGGPAVAEVRRLASREVLFLEGYADLSREERQLVDEVIAQPTRPVEQTVPPKSEDSVSAVYNTLLDYYAFNDGDDALQARKREVVLARLNLPPSSAVQRPVPPAPHSGQRPSLLQVSGLTNDELGEGAELRLRPAYFDLLSNVRGTVPYSALSMMDTRVVVRDGKVDLRQLEAVRVLSLNPKQQDRPADAGLAFEVRVGAEDRTLACDQCLLGYFEAGTGKAYELKKGIAAYGLVSGRLEAGRHAESTAHIRARGGLVMRGQYAAVSAEGGFLQGLDNGDETRPFGRAELRLGEGHRWDVRLGTEFDEALETRAAISFYW